jgi:hypothetical protein
MCKCISNLRIETSSKCSMDIVLCIKYQILFHFFSPCVTSKSWTSTLIPLILLWLTFFYCKVHWFEKLITLSSKPQLIKLSRNELFVVVENDFKSSYPKWWIWKKNIKYFTYFTYNTYSLLNISLIYHDFCSGGVKLWLESKIK